MAAGPYVFGPNRLGLWVIENSNLTDKLKHVLPRVRGPLPNLTDIFLPLSATVAAKDVVRQNSFFTHLYAVAHDTPAATLADQALKRRRYLGTGAVEFDLEGGAVADNNMAQYATDLVAAVRKTNPNLPVRLNVPPYKGYCVPVDLINADPNLYIIAQAYFGNMDGRLSEADVKDDLVGGPGIGFGINPAKVAIHYAVAAGPDPNARPVVLPNAAYKPLTTGSVYSDDLLLGAGLLP